MPGTVTICQPQWLYARHSDYMPGTVTICQPQWLYASYSDYMPAAVTICQAQWLYARHSDCMPGTLIVYAVIQATHATVGYPWYLAVVSTFNEMISAETFPCFGIFHHNIRKPFHMTRRSEIINSLHTMRTAACTSSGRPQLYRCDGAGLDTTISSLFMNIFCNIRSYFRHEKIILTWHYSKCFSFSHFQGKWYTAIAQDLGIQTKTKQTNSRIMQT